jgi:tetratricopeptide (TPR) repeat protein
MIIEPGSSLGPYGIESVIGSGGQGEVYRARDTRLNRTVALKVLPVSARNQESLDRLGREARAIASLNHAHICTLFDIGHEGGVDYLVMEYVDGESLRSRLDRGPMEFNSLVELGIQVADALACAHAAGIIHRDIKPENILFNSRNEAKVVDFGLAKNLHWSDASATWRSNDKGVIAGTVAYMSPEQTRGETLDERSDLFSLGCVLYEAATGQRPFRSTDLPGLLQEISHSEPQQAGIVNTRLPRELDLVLRRAMSKQREQRYGSSQRMAEALRSLKQTSVQPFLSTADKWAAENFVGRAAELDRLDQLVRVLIQGTGRVAFVTGEPGIGKTSLTAEFLHRARRQCPSLLASRGRCVEQYGIGEAYLPFLDALSGLLTGSRGDRVRKALRTQAPTWCLQFPAIFTSTSDLEQLKRETLGATRERMLREMGEALEALAADFPVLILLEDLHWADPSTADLLRYLGERISDRGILLLGTYRPIDLQLGGHKLKGYVQEMLAHKLCEEIALRELTEDDVRQYLGERFVPNDFPPELTSLLYRRTEGHPLFTTSLVHFLAERGDIQKVDGRWRLSRQIEEMDLEVPENVRSMIRKKIDALDENDRRVLQYASVEGEEFTSSIAAGLTGVDELTLEEHLDRLARGHRLVQAIGEEELPDGTLVTRYRFAHALYQNLFYEGLVSKRRVLLHRQAGELLLRHYAKNTFPVSAQLASHFERGRNFGRAIEYLVQAGDHATRRHSNSLAEEHYAHALGLVEKLSEEMQPRQYILLYQKRGSACMLQGRLTDAESCYQKMLDQARGTGDRESECRALIALANTANYTHKIDDLDAYGSAAMQIAEQIGNRSLWTEALGHTAQPLLTRGHLKPARERYEQAISAARALGDSRILVHSLTYRGVLHFFQSEYSKAEAAESEAFHLAGKMQDAFYVAVSLMYLGISRANQGRISEALATLNEGLEMARRNGNQVVLSRVPNCIGWIHREIEDLRPAVEFDEACVETARRTRIAEAEANGLINLVSDYTIAGERTLALKAIEAVDGLFDRDEWNRWRFFDVRHQSAAAEFWLWQGDLDKCEAHARRLLANATRYGVPKYIAVAKRILGEAAALRGDLHLAEGELIGSLESITDNSAPLVEWKNHAALARVLDSAGRPAAARQSFQMAYDIAQRIAAHISDESLRSTFLSSGPVREVSTRSRS